MLTRRIMWVLLAVVLSATAYAEFHAGVATRVVTPDPLLPVSGGIGIPNPATQKLDDLTVRALALEQGDTRVVIVGADFLGFPSVLGDKVRSLVKDVPPDNILIGVTHTHSAPDCYAFADEQGNTGADLDYLDFVCREMARAIDEAVRNLRPAAVKIATGRAQGKIAYNAYADRLYDPRCHVLQVLDRDGKPFATLINYACHPEVLGDSQGILSPDFCGPLYQRVEEKGGGIGIFMNSAQGGMVTADCRGPDGKDMRTWEECLRIGRLLADEALRIVADAPVQQDPSLFCASRIVTFPVESDTIRSAILQSPLKYPSIESSTVTTRVTLVNLGNAQMLTIPGEALPNIGYYLKRKMNGEHNFLLGLTNDAFGYILVKEDWDSFDRYAYITRTCLGELTGEMFINEALKLVEESPVPARL